jgi:hypothetical protein
VGTNLNTTDDPAQAGFFVSNKETGDGQDGEYSSIRVSEENI